MNKVIKYTLIILALVLIILQFVGPQKPQVVDANPNDLIQLESIEEPIALVLKDACYDCHSMETSYPWYAHIAPVSWSIFNHVNHGREEMNLSEWGSLDKRKKIKVLKDIAEEVEGGEMPLSSYVRMHREAKLTDIQKEALVNWSNAFAKQVFQGD